MAKLDTDKALVIGVVILAGGIIFLVYSAGGAIKDAAKTLYDTAGNAVHKAGEIVQQGFTPVPQNQLPFWEGNGTVPESPGGGETDPNDPLSLNSQDASTAAELLN